VEHLLSSMEKAIPSIRQARIIRTMAGVRPLLDQPGTDERQLTRHYKVYDHEELDEVRGFLTIAGGKMVIYRIMAEDLTNLLCRKLGREDSCRTKEDPLPGGEEQANPTALAEEFGLPLYTVARVVSRHGARARRVLERCREEPQSKSHVCVCEPVTEAEIRYAITHEWARTLDDVRRRTRLGMGPCQGCHCTKIAAGVLVDERGEPAKRGHQEVLDFLQERWKGREPVLTGAQLRQEELLRACYLGVGGYHNPALERVSQ
jgi:glycerol-3-phosphate dehydrogenase